MGRMARRYVRPGRGTSGTHLISAAPTALFLGDQLDPLEADPAVLVGEGRVGRDAQVVVPGLGAAEVERLEAFGEVAARPGRRAEPLGEDGPATAHVVQIQRVRAGPAG